MLRTINLAFCISIVVVSLATFFDYLGGELLLVFGNSVAIGVNVFLLLFSGDNQEWYKVPKAGVFLINVLIYAGLAIFIMIAAKYLRKSMMK